LIDDKKGVREKPYPFLFHDFASILFNSYPQFLLRLIDDKNQLFSYRISSQNKYQYMIEIE